jgi:cyclic pyranopterin phosphate synthase
MPEFTHLDTNGHVRMVDVSDKKATARTAVAGGAISMTAETYDRIQRQAVKKGNVLETARIAGIMAAKRASELIPMCHPIGITHAQVDFIPEDAHHRFNIQAQVRTIDQTGVEMEALTAVSVAALTIYDMCKSHDRGMTISDIRLLEKSGGKSGTYKKNQDNE